jgi:cyclase
MASEAFVPLSYGGNIQSLLDAKHIISLGFEKVIVNSLFYTNLNEVIQIANELGSQSVVLKIDYRMVHKDYYFYSKGKITEKIEFNTLIEKIHKANVGELILSRVDFDGNKCDFDTQFPLNFTKSIKIPIVLSNGAKDKNSIFKAINLNFHNFTASSIYVYVGSLDGILINNPFID